MTGRLILLRHGESVANAGDFFAGWMDVPLTTLGVTQAREAGRLLKDEAISHIHTSVLRRATCTASLAAHAAGWTTPIIRDWRLNERHYGALQSLKKDDARRRYGEEQVAQWRRSADARPPEASRTAMVRQFTDRRYMCQPNARAIRAESLVDVAVRMQPYWSRVLMPALMRDETVLVVAHGNAIRVLWHLATELPLEESARLSVPTAQPLIPEAVVPSTRAARSR